MKNDLFDLSGRVVVVTGGARGLGQAAAIGLAAFGADVAIVDLKDQHGEVTDRLLRARDFSAAEIAEFHEAACVRAGEMCAGAPFVVVMM